MVGCGVLIKTTITFSTLPFSFYLDNDTFLLTSVISERLPNSAKECDCCPPETCYVGPQVHYIHLVTFMDYPYSVLLQNIK